MKISFNTKNILLYLKHKGSGLLSDEDWNKFYFERPHLYDVWVKLLTGWKFRATQLEACVAAAMLSLENEVHDVGLN